MTGILRKTSESKSLSGKRLLEDIRELINNARELTSQAVNRGLVFLYWTIGDRIRREILKEKRAGYGEKIISAIGIRLSEEFGQGFSKRNLSNMVKFAEVYPDPRIVQTLSAQLSWSHFVLLLSFADDLKRDFYAEMCRIERWSVRTLKDKIDGLLYERTAISKKPKKLAGIELRNLRKEDKLTPDLVFRDPYLLDFLGLKDSYSEKDLESSILRELERFILELGAGFSFVERQKRITVDSEDYYLDLLFFHRPLKRLVAIELKLGKFQAADKGQMELYLRWLDAKEKQPGENTPLGLILCAGKSTEHVALLKLEKSGIRVAEYLTELPPRRVLEKKLHQAIQAARIQLDKQMGGIMP